MKHLCWIAGASLLAIACELPDTFGLDDIPTEDIPLALTGTVYASSFASSWTHAVLPMPSNAHLASAAGVAINANGWVAGATEANFDGQWFSTTHATVWTPAGSHDLGVLPPHFGSQRSWAHAINDAGMVAGMSNGANANGDCCVFRAFVWTEAAGMQALPLLAATASAEARAHGINNLGHIVGQATDAAGVTHAVLWMAPDQAPLDLGTFGGSAIAYGINDNGQVIGNGTAGAFLWSQAAGTQLLGDLGGDYAQPFDINNDGHVVGLAYLADGTQHPFLWTPAGGMQDLGLPPGAAHAAARGINQAGHIAVSTIDENPETGEIDTRAFLWIDGTWLGLESPDYALATASAINDQLQIAGGAFAGMTGQNSAIRWAVTITPAGSGRVFDGFYTPVQNLPMVNRVRAGQAVPVKFSLGGDHGLAIFAPGYPTSQPIVCDAAAPSGSIDATASAGHSTLSYDPITDRYVYVWKTEKSWAGSCRRLVVRFDDGTEHEARFEFTR